MSHFEGSVGDTTVTSTVVDEFKDETLEMIFMSELKQGLKNWIITSDEIAEENEIVSYENYLKRKRNSDSGDAESEYDRYLSLPIISSTKADVLQFWKSNTFNFPTLVAMAKDYLTVQA